MKLVVPSGFLAARPMATESQVNASVSRATIPSTPSQASALACGRKPSRADTPTVTATASSVLMTAPTTWPVRTDVRAIRMVLKRAMMPSVMSRLTASAVVEQP